MELRITEIFLSIQGESSHAGRPCSFVRLTGCPMRCVWCDSEYTFTGGERISFEDIFSRLEEFGCNLVEVTGGEPLAQKAVFPFITELCERGYEVLIETGGYVSTEDVDPRAKIILDVKCPASGEAGRNHWPNLERLRHEKDEVKFVIADMADWEYAKEIITRYELVDRVKEILISPVHDIVNLAGVAEAVSRSGLKVRLNLQLHKYIWGVDAVESKAIVLVSGGMDSCVTTAIAHSANDDLAFLHISYGQLTEARERQAFNDIADHYGVEMRLDISIEHLAKIGGSSLTDETIAVSEADLESKAIPTSYVPFRNANMLSIAVSWAEVIGATAVYIGAVAEDSSGYPDCRPEFYAAFQRTIETGTKPDTHIQIRTPIIALSKADIVKKGIELAAPLHLTWSCYRSETLACGTCDSCALRLRGFALANVIDPINYCT